MRQTLDRQRTHARNTGDMAHQRIAQLDRLCRAQAIGSGKQVTSRSIGLRGGAPKLNATEILDGADHFVLYSVAPLAFKTWKDNARDPNYRGAQRPDV